jgi:hypothetical protein
MRHPHCNIELGKNRLIQVTEWKVEIHIDIVVGLKCHVYVFSEMTFVLPVFGED